MPPPYQAPTVPRPYFPAPAAPPVAPSTAIVRPTETEDPPRAGLIEWTLDGLKSRLPEFGANAGATRANFSEMGRAFWKFFQAPMSMAVTLVAGAISASMRAEGPIGSNANRIAVGAAHATIAELSRPKQQGTTQETAAPHADAAPEQLNTSP